jgi:hypothetical protein
MTESLDQLVTYCRENGRVCPRVPTYVAGEAMDPNPRCTPVLTPSCSNESLQTGVRLKETL